MSKLVIAAIGPASSVQDGGRPGAQRYGLVPSGAMDRLALAAANTLVGNAPFAAAVEVGPFGAAFTARGGAVRIALAGAPRNADIAGRPGGFGYFRDACRRRDADAGLCARRLVQLSRDRRRHCGRADVRQPRRQRARRARQPLSAPAAGRRRIADESGAAARPERRIELPAATDAPIRVVWGPQDDEFADETKKLFLDSEWKISATSDRMGYRLEGPVLKHLHGHNIVSDGTVNGSIQVPGNGAADRADAGPRHQRRLSQDRDRDLGRFRTVRADPRRARAFASRPSAWRKRRRRRANLRNCCAPCPTGCAPIESVDLNIDALHDANVAGHAVSAVDAGTWHAVTGRRVGTGLIDQDPLTRSGQAS